MIIGICGKSGSGKSTLSRKIMDSLDNDAVYLDIDEISHRVLKYDLVQKELISSFGETILDNNIVDRKKLSEIVFNSRSEMNKLSKITWKYMQIEINDFLKQNKDKTIILDWILLPITKYFNICNIKVFLDVPYELRKERAMERDNISEEAFALREKSSVNFNKNRFDYVISEVNEETIKGLVKKND